MIQKSNVWYSRVEKSVLFYISVKMNPTKSQVPKERRAFFLRLSEIVMTPFSRSKNPRETNPFQAHKRGSILRLKNRNIV
jgi:hypothetical protein